VSHTPSSKLKKFLNIFTLILAGEAIFFLPFILPRVFRPTMLQAFDITNLELGTTFSIYGIVAMLSYFFGGPLADRFPARNLMAIALWLTGLGGLIMYQIPSLQTLEIIYGYWGFTTIFLFWAALIKATREWGGSDGQGTAFGLLEGGRGLSSSLIGTLGLVVFSGIVLTGTANAISESRNEVFGRVILVTTGVVFLVGIMVWFFVPKRTDIDQLKSAPPSMAQFFELLRIPVIWLQAVIIVCAYVGYKITDDFSLYAYDVLGFSEQESATLGTVVLWMRPVFALMVGLLADRFNGPKLIMICFGAMILGGGLISLHVWPGLLTWTMLLIATTCAGVYGIRGIYFALMREAKIPLSATGAAVGIMSLVGFTPDIFVGPIMGYLLDENPGVLGHQFVFGGMVLFAFIGLIAGWRFYSLVVRNS
jgi:MFS family permease